jgi:hypothetical protein
MKKVILYSVFNLIMATCAISQTQKTTENFDNYGTKVGFGIKILDGLGVSVRYYNSPKKVIDAGIGLGGYATFKTNNNNETVFNYFPGTVLSAGFTYFGDRFEKTKKKKVKIRANGVVFRGNYLTGKYPTFSPSLGWAMETFKKDRTNRSFIFELGLKSNFKNFNYDNEVTSVLPVGIYLRCHWNFFL